MAAVRYAITRSRTFSISFLRKSLKPPESISASTSVATYPFGNAVPSVRLKKVNRRGGLKTFWSPSSPKDATRNGETLWVSPDSSTVVPPRSISSEPASEPRKPLVSSSQRTLWMRSSSLVSRWAAAAGGVAASFTCAAPAAAASATSCARVSRTFGAPSAAACFSIAVGLARSTAASSSSRRCCTAAGALIRFATATPAALRSVAGSARNRRASTCSMLPDSSGSGNAAGSAVLAATFSAASSNSRTTRFSTARRAGSFGCPTRASTMSTMGIPLRYGAASVTAPTRTACRARATRWHTAPRHPAAALP